MLKFMLVNVLLTSCELFKSYADRVVVGDESGVVNATKSESEESNVSVLLRLRRLRSDENQIAGVGSRSARINQSQCSFPRFVIG